MTNGYDKIRKQITDLRMDYDELTDWVSQLHHKLDNHIREYQKKQSFFKRYRDILSILAGIAVLLALVVLSGLKIRGVI